MEKGGYSQAWFVAKTTPLKGLKFLLVLAGYRHWAPKGAKTDYNVIIRFSIDDKFHLTHLWVKSR